MAEKSLIRPFLGLFGILLAILGTFLQLRFQSAATSPFHTHRLHIAAFFTLIVICAVSVAVEINFEAAGLDCPAIVSTVFLLAGSLALILLLLIIEPYVGWPVLIVWLVLVVACESYEQIRDSIVSAVERATNFLKTLFNCKIFLLAGSLALTVLLLIVEPYVGWPVLIVWFVCFVKLTCESYEQIRDSIVSAVLYVWFVYFVKLTCESYEQIRDSIVSAAKRASDFLKTLFNCNRNQKGEANQATTDNVYAKRVSI